MIYDYIDIVSKVGIVHIVRRWLSLEANSQALKTLCSKYNIFGTKIPDDKEDADVWRCLMMMGAGIIMPIMIKDKAGKVGYNIGLRNGWEVPLWIYNQKSWFKLMISLWV